MQLQDGNDIRAERARRGVSRFWLSKMTGIPFTTLGGIERGGALPTQKQLELIIAAFKWFDDRPVVNVA